MLKYSAIAAVAGTLTLGALPATPAFAAHGVMVPAGDSLDFTPPEDWTLGEIEAAPPREQRKVAALREGRSIAVHHRSHRIGVVARGQ